MSTFLLFFHAENEEQPESSDIAEDILDPVFVFDTLICILSCRHLLFLAKVGITTLKILLVFDVKYFSIVIVCTFFFCMHSYLRNQRLPVLEMLH